MNLIDLTNYVNLDVDDTFTSIEVGRWFNKGISQFNLLPPLTTYPTVLLTTRQTSTATTYFLDDTYPLSDTFMLGIMLPYLVASVKGQEASLSERQVMLQEFLQNGRMFKASVNIDLEYMLNQQNTDLDIYQLGENVFVSDMTKSPFPGNWGTATQYYEIEEEEE